MCSAVREQSLLNGMTTNVVLLSLLLLAQCVENRQQGPGIPLAPLPISLPSFLSRRDVLFPTDGPQPRCPADETCVRVSECDNFQPAGLSSFPKPCDFQGTEPLICCKKNYGIVPEPSFVCGVSNSKHRLIPERIKRARFPSTLLALPKPGKSEILVVGGQTAEVGKWPWMAAIGEVTQNNQKRWFCGGALINERYILSAAHCFRDGKANIVRLGEQDLDSTNDGAEPVDYTIEEVVRHPDFRYPNLEHDLALIRLQRRVTLGRFIQPVCLQPNQKNYEGESVSVTGWGLLSFGGSASPVLQEVEIPIVSLSACNTSYTSVTSLRFYFPRGITPNMMCAGDIKEGGKDACSGDSGAPLVYFNQDTQTYSVVGIVSGGYGCGAKGFPGIYTRVFSYLPWVNSVAFN